MFKLYKNNLQQLFILILHCLSLASGTTHSLSYCLWPWANVTHSVYWVLILLIHDIPLENSVTLYFFNWGMIWAIVIPLFIRKVEPRSVGNIHLSIHSDRPVKSWTCQWINEGKWISFYFDDINFKNPQSRMLAIRFGSKSLAHKKHYAFNELLRPMGRNRKYLYTVHRQASRTAYRGVYNRMTEEEFRYDGCSSHTSWQCILYRSSVILNAVLNHHIGTCYPLSLAITVQVIICKHGDSGTVDQLHEGWVARICLQSERNVLYTVYDLLNIRFQYCSGNSQLNRWFFLPCRSASKSCILYRFSS